MYKYFRLEHGRIDCTHVLDGNDLARSPVNGFVHLSKASTYLAVNLCYSHTCFATYCPTPPSPGSFPPLCC
jgi:hypothetical protein